MLIADDARNIVVHRSLNTTFQCKLTAHMLQSGWSRIIRSATQLSFARIIWV